MAEAEEWAFGFGLGFAPEGRKWGIGWQILEIFEGGDAASSSLKVYYRF